MYICTAVFYTMHLYDTLYIYSYTSHIFIHIQDAEKGVIFLTFPPVLTIHLKRFDFDYQRMGFSKIHDYYEYPETLDLTRYLAEDSPQLSSRGDLGGADRMSGSDGTSKGEGTGGEGEKGEGGENKPIYTLHSVLVHQGDVGGGHYYAYIKPSGNTTPLKSGGNEKEPLKNGGWYKFNDEIVLNVTQKEVFTSCFGKKIDSPFVNYHNYDSLGSAYMLVYIQISHIHNIMIPVDETSIPTDLKLRLHKFEFQKYIYDIYYNKIYNKLLYNKQYILEEDIAMYNKYTIKQDFIDLYTNNNNTNNNNTNNKYRYIKCITHCTTLYYARSISYILNIPLYRIRLWVIEKLNSSNEKVHNKHNNTTTTYHIPPRYCYSICIILNNVYIYIALYVYLHCIYHYILYLSLLLLIIIIIIIIL